jgi:hypothetical protein
MTQPGKPCIFCGKYGNKNKQHILPDRLKNLVPRESAAYTERREKYEYGRDGSLLGTNPEFNHHAGHLGNRRLRVVCAECNGGWMRTGEEAGFVVAEPLIVGETPVLSPEDQTKLALLAAIVFAMIDRTDTRSIVLRDEDRQYIRDHQAPPPNWQLFLGRVDAPDWKTRYMRHAAISLPKGVVPSGEQSNCQAVTLAIGNLALHLVMARDFETLPRPDQYASRFGIARFPLPVTHIDTSRLPVLNGGQMVMLSETLAATSWSNGY